MELSNEMNGNVLAYAPRASESLFAKTIKRIVSANKRRKARNKSYRELNALSDWMLMDIGVSRTQIPVLVDAMLNTVESFPATRGISVGTIQDIAKDITSRKAA